MPIAEIAILGVSDAYRAILDEVGYMRILPPKFSAAFRYLPRSLSRTYLHGIQS